MPKVIQYNKGSVIYFEGDTDERIFILQKGRAVSTTVDIETKERHSEPIKNGEFFGAKSALGHFPREETVSVVEDSVCVAMSVPEFETMFGPNKQVIMKMMRVFSSQLRQVHSKTESILNKDEEINQVSGMLSVGQAFFDDEHYRSCCDVCLSFLKRYPTYPHKEDIAKMYTIAKSKAEYQAATHHADDEEMEAHANDAALKQFDLPAFQRFAKTYEPGQVIICEFEPGDSFYLIQSGKVQLVKFINGVNKNLDILLPGEFFGEMAILDNSPRSATCMAAGKVKCLEFNKANFELLITSNPQLALKLLKLFCKRIYDQKRRLKILIIDDLQARVAEVLVMLEEITPGVKTADRRRVETTIHDIASWAGLSVEATRAEIDNFSARKKIEVYENYIVINSITDMKRMANNGQISRN